MPPCAAMECARRGESWKQKHLTLYPSSLIVAAAAPPARPLPTTMTVYFRLLAGFTSFISNLCLSHFPSIGPSGTLDLSSMRVSRSWPDHPRVHGNRNHGEARPDQHRQG